MPPYFKKPTGDLDVHLHLRTWTLGKQTNWIHFEIQGLCSLSGDAKKKDSSNELQKSPQSEILTVQVQASPRKRGESTSGRMWLCKEVSLASTATWTEGRRCWIKLWSRRADAKTHKEVMAIKLLVSSHFRPQGNTEKATRHLGAMQQP